MNSNKLAISVIIATLNRSEDLKKALDSVLLQTLKPTEIIIVDQSPDKKTEELTAQFEKQVRGGLRFVYMKQEEKSAVQARNRGLSVVKGDIISFIDDDVVLDRNYFEHIERYLREHPLVGGVSGSDEADHGFKGWRWQLRKVLLQLFLISHFDGKMTLSGFGYPIFERTIKKETAVEMLPGCDMNYRAKYIQDRKFDEWFVGYSYREDADFSYALSRLCSLSMIPEAKLCHNHSVANRLAPIEQKIMEIKNTRYVFRKFKGRGWWPEFLFSYSLAGLVFIDLLELLASFKKRQLQKFLTSLSASWSVLRHAD